MHLCPTLDLQQKKFKNVKFGENTFQQKKPFCDTVHQKFTKIQKYLNKPKHAKNYGGWLIK